MRPHNFEGKRKIQTYLNGLIHQECTFCTQSFGKVLGLHLNLVNKKFHAKAELITSLL